jgi:hypothetical protein
VLPCTHTCRPVCMYVAESWNQRNGVRKYPKNCLFKDIPRIEIWPKMSSCTNRINILAICSTLCQQIGDGLFLWGIDWRRNPLSYQDSVDSIGLAAIFYFLISRHLFCFLAGKKRKSAHRAACLYRKAAKFFR